MRRLALFLLPLCLACLTLTSCPADSGGGDKVIGMTVQTLTNPFFTVIANNLESAVKDKGFTLNLQGAGQDPVKQRQQVQDFIQKKVVAIVINPADSKGIGPAIQEANKAGIPVFTVDLRCSDPAAKVVSQLGTDNYGGGRLAADAMIEALGTAGGKIALLDFEKVESCIERERGFKDVLKEHNAKTKDGKVEIVIELGCEGDRDKGYKNAQDAISTHKDLRGLFAINDPAALGARAALEKGGKADQVVIVGFDGQPEGKKAIRDGKIYADPIQFPDRMGRETGLAIMDHLNGKTVKPSVDIPTSLYRKADGLKDESLK
ncbi:MAG: substrate-binding domain-containing protein [Planctomycetota bacterium]